METPFPADNSRPFDTTSVNTALSDTATSLAHVACNIRQTAIVARYMNGGDRDWARTGLDYLITTFRDDIHAVKKIINQIKRRLQGGRVNQSLYERGQFLRSELREQRKNMITLTGLATIILEDTTAPANQVGIWFSRQLDARAAALTEIAGHLSAIATAQQRERTAHAGQ